MFKRFIVNKIVRKSDFLRQQLIFIFLIFVLQLIFVYDILFLEKEQIMKLWTSKQFKNQYFAAFKRGYFCIGVNMKV